MSTAQTGGGAATHSGTEYQNRLAAWIAVRILAERAATPPWDLAAKETLDFLRCETLEPVDDSLVGVSNAGHVFLQAKHTVTLGATAESEFASVMDQFVRQSGRYERESLAIGEIVNVVNTMLADFRHLLQDDQEMREAMVSMLDIFVEAGWPQAIQLTYRLDEIFR